MADWDEKFMDLAQFVGEWSRNDGRKVGAVIVNSRNVVLQIGYNGFPRGIEEDKPGRKTREERYVWTEHAERNAIFNAANVGISTAGATLYVPWMPCVECARAIIQAGIVRVVGRKLQQDEEIWNFDLSLEMLAEAGVQVELLE